MSNTYPILYIGLFTCIVLVARFIIRRLLGTIVATFPAQVKDMRKTLIWTDVGVFVPIYSTTLIIDGDREVKVNEWDAKHVRIGDTIWVHRYSTGKYHMTTKFTNLTHASEGI